MMSLTTPEQHPWFLSHPLYADNIISHWAQAHQDEIVDGLRWYADAHQVAAAIAGGDVQLGAGMIANYSAQQNWVTALHTAAMAIRQRQGIGGPDSGTFASLARKRTADELLAGRPYTETFYGPKILAFAHLIHYAGDRDPAEPHVAIDRHALSVAHGRALTDTEYKTAPLRGASRHAGTAGLRRYQYVADLYISAAAAISTNLSRQVAPHQAQAVSWIVRQRLNQQQKLDRGLTYDDIGRETGRQRAEEQWHAFVTRHLPTLDRYPGTGYASLPLQRLTR